MTDGEWVVDPTQKIDLSQVTLPPDASQTAIDWRDAAFAKLADVENQLTIKFCVPVSCPSFEDTTLEVERCPSCGRAELKWYSSQPFPCDDKFHELPDTGLRHYNDVGPDEPMPPAVVFDGV